MTPRHDNAITPGAEVEHPVDSSNAPPADQSSIEPAPAPRPPSRPERIFTATLLVLFGIAFGLGLFTFSYAKGFSYLSNDPAACVNCHIMRDQYEGWSHSSHKAVATCNDCHTPHRFPDKWVIKGVNGWNHSVAFTTGNFPEPIMIRGFNARIAQENCVECHATTVTQMHLYVSTEELQCVACHGNVGHNNAAPNVQYGAWNDIAGEVEAQRSRPIAPDVEPATTTVTSAISTTLESVNRPESDE